MLFPFRTDLYMEQNNSVFFPPGSIPPVRELHFFEEKISDLVHFLMFSSLFVGIAGGGMVYVASFAQGVACEPVAIAIMFLVGFSVYNLNRKTDEAEDAVNRADRFFFTKKFEKHLFVSALAAYAAAIGLAACFGLLSVVVVLVPLVSGILYSIPCLPRLTGYRRLKEIPVVKNLVVGIAWGSTLTFIPLVLTGSPAGMATFVTLVFFSTYAFIASTLPDIRDREGDAQAGIRTIPVVLGEERTIRILAGLNLLVGLAALITSLLFLSPVTSLIFLMSTIYLALCIRSFLRVRKKDLVCDVLTDGQFLVIGLITYCGLCSQAVLLAGMV